jgi:hypothetical protein
MAVHVALMEKKRVVYRILVGKPEEKRPLERPRPRREGNKKTDFRSWMGTWSGLIWLRIATCDGLF